MINNVIKVIEDYLNKKTEKNIFKNKIHKLIDKNQETLYKEDEEIADLITYELIEICNKDIEDDDKFKEEISAIFEEIKIIIEL
ncbi:hypothetical protein [Anaerofustis stercorihominis]|uniref:hypothetical protein n=1 Tax=Anaerofustis stercorihominis TaxID=214853 RepID=UPI00110619DE|nr:hypothetical protein [Anaerofustis stercorihominis]